MTITVTLPTAATEPLAAAAFQALLDERALLAAETARPVIAPSRLYAYAAGVNDADAEVEAALAADPRLAADFARMLGRAATWRLPRLAAASSGENLVRSGENCRIELRRSEAEPSQIYLIIELAAPETLPTRLFAAREGGQVVSADLPAARDGVIQLLAGADTPLVAALRDVGAEVFLR
ncbi:MAG: hypothetical protein RIM84_25885 [Alphaproteobacteria bacterium]